MSYPSFGDGVPTWEEAMKPLSESELWPVIRREASRVIESRMRETGDTESGISGSDINHTIYGYAKRENYKWPKEVYAEAVLRSIREAI